MNRRDAVLSLLALGAAPLEANSGLLKHSVQDAAIACSISGLGDAENYLAPVVSTADKKRPAMVIVRSGCEEVPPEIVNESFAVA